MTTQDQQAAGSGTFYYEIKLNRCINNTKLFQLKNDKASKLGIIGSKSVDVHEPIKEQDLSLRKHRSVEYFQ